MSGLTLINYGNPKAVCTIPSILGEGPVWDHRCGLLYWLDCFSNRINIYDPETEKNIFLILPEVVGSIVPVAGEHDSGEDSGDLILIAALESGFYSLRITVFFTRRPDFTGRIPDSAFKLSFLSNPEEEIEGNRFNDGKCDPSGRFWAGTMSRALDSGAGDLTPKGSLYRMEGIAGGKTAVTKILDNVIISNGLAFHPDGRVMYYNDTPTRQISAFDFDQNTGAITNRRRAFSIPDGWGGPDGMTIDEEGMLWVALWGDFRVVRIDPNKGEPLGEIPLPVRNVTACTFGGKELDELYITTSRVGIDEDEESDPELAGSLFRLKLPVRGLQTNFFL